MTAYDPFAGAGAPMVDAELQSAIDAIDPATLDYDGWLTVYAAMHDAGVPLDVAEEWNRRDPDRCDERANVRKWEGFNNTATPDVARRTIFKAASAAGWRWHGQATGPATPNAAARPSGTGGEAYPLLRLTVPEGYTPPTPPDLEPSDQMLWQLSAMFCDGELVNTFIRGPRWNADRHKWEPVGHGECAELGEFWGDGRAARALADANPDAGAWVRVNPMDGKGGSDRNVTAHRLALVEFDDMPKDMQLAAYELLNLPCACIVDSGNKSVHAFVRIDARDAAEYRERVGWLYGLLKANGLEPDGANRNPARWARLAGATRGGSTQRLIAANTGATSWDEWRAWVAEHDTRTPEPDAETATAETATADGGVPQIKFVDYTACVGMASRPLDYVVEGLLPREQVGMIVAKGGSGKTFLGYEMMFSVATGRDWLGFGCRRGRVLYVDPELHEDLISQRISDVTCAMGLTPADVSGMFEIVPLRGTMATAPMLNAAIRDHIATEGRGYDLIIVDSINAILEGDENSSVDVRRFVIMLQRLARDTHAAVMTFHHEGKAAKGTGQRGRGSSVFHDGPDECMELVQLKVAEDSAAADVLRAHARKRADGRTVYASAWRLLFTKHRADAQISPVNVIFRHPLHVVDVSGELGECPIAGSAEDNGRKGGEKRATATGETWQLMNEIMQSVIEDIKDEGGTATRAACLELLNERRKMQGMKPWSRATLRNATLRGGKLDYRVNLSTNELERMTDEQRAAEGCREGSIQYGTGGADGY